MGSEVTIVGKEVVAKGWGRLTRYTIEQGPPEARARHDRDVYEIGDAASVLLYDPEAGTVVLVRQFRLVVMLRGDNEGLLVEACAGLLDGDEPAACAMREAEEEAGYRVASVQHVATCYLSPGGLSQKIHCFVGEYSPADRVSSGGGLEAEGEQIEVLELPFPQALAMIGREIVDAQTILLLQHLALSGLMKR